MESCKKIEEGEKWNNFRGTLRLVQQLPVLKNYTVVLNLLGYLKLHIFLWCQQRK